MKYILTLVFALTILSSAAQTTTKKDTSEYASYSACTECFENWKTTTEKVSPSQVHTLTQNRMAQQSPYVSNFGRTMKNIVVGIVVGAITLFIITKTTNITNEIIPHQ